MKIITISREYCAGGHSVGNKVADRLGIELYDQDIISAVAETSGLDYETVQKTEESITKLDTFVHAISPVFYEQKDKIFEKQVEAILKFANKGPCVILGRCADDILRTAGFDTLNVFLYADYEHRAERAAKLLGTNDAAAIKKAIKITDSNRHSFYNYYTDRNWKDFSNYNLMLDTGALGYDKCVELICAAAQD